MRSRPTADMPRLVRRAPLQTRIKNYIWDTLLWLSENLDAEEWAEAQKEWALPVGLVLNLVFLLARSNSAGESRGSSDVFGDYESRRGSDWFRWLVRLSIYASENTADYTCSVALLCSP